MAKQKRILTSILIIIGISLIFIFLPKILLILFWNISIKDVEAPTREFYTQKYYKELFYESNNILALANFVEINKHSLLDKGCLQLPEDLSKLRARNIKEAKFDSLSTYLNNIKSDKIKEYKFCYPTSIGLAGQQSEDVLETIIALEAKEIFDNSQCYVYHYIYNNSIVWINYKIEDIYGIPERDTVYQGTFRYAIKVIPNTL